MLVGIKRRWWFGYKKFKISNYFIEYKLDEIPGLFRPKLKLILWDGTEVSIPNYDALHFRVFSQPLMQQQQQPQYYPPPVPQQTLTPQDLMAMKQANDRQRMRAV